MAHSRPNVKDYDRTNLKKTPKNSKTQGREDHLHILKSMRHTWYWYISPRKLIAFIIKCVVKLLNLFQNLSGAVVEIWEWIYVISSHTW